MRQVLVVLNHEWRYFKTLNRIIKSILIQTFAPAIILILYAYFNKVIDLRIAVIIMIIGIPRIPMALTGYSMAGEKVYKTLESIVSTPIQVKELLIGKTILPIGISIIMFLLSSIITLIFANLYAILGFKASSVTIFSLTEWTVIFGGGIPIVMWIIFLTGLLTLVVKVPRNGLFITSLTTFIMGIPYSIILFLYPESAFQLSALCMLIFLLINTLCYGVILGKLKTPKFFSKA